MAQETHSSESSEEYDLKEDNLETEDCFGETLFQFYSKTMADSGEDPIKFLHLISFIDSTFKSASDFVSSHVAIEHREEKMAKISDDNFVVENEEVLGDDGPCIEQENEEKNAVPNTFEQKLEELIIRHLLSCKSVRAIVSQCKRQIIQGNVEHGQYIAYINALDSSKNVNLGYPCGSTFSFVKFPKEKRKECRLNLVEEDVVIPFDQVVIAGFAFYGFRTELAIAVRDQGLQNFSLDLDLGLFLLTKPNIEIPKKAIFYSGNRSDSSQWPLQIRAFLDLMSPLHFFWPGGFMQQLWGILQSGGIFFAPVTIDLIAEIPVLSVAFPISLIMKEGGGDSFPINCGFREEDFLQFRPKTPYETTGNLSGLPNISSATKRRNNKTATV